MPLCYTSIVLKLTNQERRKMEKRCLVCKKGFIVGKYWQKFCSPKCRMIMWVFVQFCKKHTLEDIKKLYEEAGKELL